MTRCCEHCEKPLVRPSGMGQRDWLRKRFCSQRCRTDSGNAWIGPRGGYTEDHSSVVAASASLRNRILAMFDKTARAKGITLEQAAFLHLCPTQ